MAKWWKQGGDWHVRTVAGSPMNLNSSTGALYVLGLQKRIEELTAELNSLKKPRRGRKAGPKETK